MPQIEDVSQELRVLIKKYDADYIEARLEQNQTSHIS